MKLSEIDIIIQTVEFAGERMINVQGLYSLMETGFLIELDECLITPYYIQENKRMELYQYELCCTRETDFDRYILKATGKSCMADIPNEIVSLRKACFATVGENYRLKEFLEFILENRNIQKEIDKHFGSYSAKNLYIIIY